MKNLLFYLAFCTTLALNGQSEGTAERPNVLILLSDDLSYHDLGCYGNAEVRTPNIDQLARAGMRFNYCFNSAPMCAPTRMSLYTGIHPVRNGAHPNHSKVYPSIRSMPHYLGELGYRVALLGKRHYKPLENFPFEHLGGRGHDNGEGLDLDLNRAKTYFADNKERPWCLVVASNQSHTPWNRGDATTYDAEQLSLPPYLVDTKETRAGLANYYAEITYFDQQLGRCLQYLEESGQAANTIVIFLSEQGSNLPHCKWTCYDTGLRSAAIIRYPGLTKAHTVSDAMIQYVDILPTLLDLMGDDPAKYDLDGRSFLRVLQGRKQSHHRAVFGLQTSLGIFDGPEAYGIRTIRTKRYRLIWNVNPENEFSNLVISQNGPYGIFGSWIEAAEAGDAFAQARVSNYKKRPEWEFYDLKKDPFELQNLSAQATYQSKIKNLKLKLLAWMKQQNDLGAATERVAKERQ